MLRQQVKEVDVKILGGYLDAVGSERTSQHLTPCS